MDLELLKTFFAHAVAHGIRYRLGAKCPLDADTATVAEIDCSGFSRWALYRASHGAVTLPEGSQPQKVWAAEHWGPRISYEECAEIDGRLRIAFLSPVPGKKWPRHVWLVLDARTMESRGRAGVSSQSWKSYRGRASACFLVPD